MILSDRIQLIEEMIRENPEYTIRDYLDAVKEITDVEEASEEVFMQNRLKVDRKIAFVNQNINRDSRGRFIRRIDQKVAS